MTKEEIVEKLRKTEETILIELLGITSDDLVDAFSDVIDERFIFLEKSLDE